MAIITALFGGVGLVATAQATAQRHPARAPQIEWLGGMLLVASLVGLGFNLAQTAG